MTRKLTIVFVAAACAAACTQTPTTPSPVVTAAPSAIEATSTEGRWGTASVPLPPSGLSYSVLGDTLKLSWNPPPGGDPPTSYVIEAGTSPGASNITGPAGVDTGSAETTFSKSGVQNGVYYIRVRARNASGASAATSEIAAVMGPGGPGGCATSPNTPSAFSTAVNGNTVTLAWAPPQGGCPPTDYLIEYGTQPGVFPNSLRVDASTTTVTVTAPSGTYYVRLRARNAAGDSVPTNSGTVTPGRTQPPAPTAPTCRQCTVDYENTVAGCSSYRTLIEQLQCTNRALAVWQECIRICVPPYDPFAAVLKQ